MKWNQVITIGRQFGSGGREIGERVAKALQIPCYDRALIDLATQKLGVDQYDLEQVDEEALNRFLAAYQVPKKGNSLTGYGLTLNDSLYLAQKDIIEKLATKGPCVIIGRTADDVLKQNPKCINIFICATKQDRVKRIMGRYLISAKEAKDAIRRVDRRRRYYYENYTDKTWGKPESHQITLNVSLLGVEKTVEVIQAIYQEEAERED